MGVITKGLDRIKAGDDADQARWFDINVLPVDLAFDHDEVLKYAISRLQTEKVYHSSTGA